MDSLDFSHITQSVTSIEPFEISTERLAEATVGLYELYIQKTYLLTTYGLLSRVTIKNGEFILCAM